MWDNITHKHETKVVAVTKDIERAISPDKVTEMYDKVRSQAEKDIIASLRVESNSLNGIVVQIQDEYSTDTSRIHTRFILNGEEHIAIETLSHEETLSHGELFDKLAKHYRETVAMKVFRDGAEKLSKAFRI